MSMLVMNGHVAYPGGISTSLVNVLAPFLSVNWNVMRIKDARAMLRRLQKRPMESVFMQLHHFRAHINVLSSSLVRLGHWL